LAELKEEAMLVGATDFKLGCGEIVSTIAGCIFLCYK